MLEKMKSCFSYHCVLHALLGLGLGLAIARLYPMQHMGKAGLTLVVIVIILDYLRK